MHEEAIGSLASLESREINETAYGVCLFHEDWHQGVVGIVAGRIRERINRPVIAFALASGDEIKGSARSVAGVHVRDTLDAVAAAHPGLISKFGGHAMAAGMVLRRADLAAFARAFDVEVEGRMSPETLRDVVYTDGELGASDLGLEMAEALQRAGPWGQGFPEPLFDGEFDLQAPRVVADRHLRFVLRPDRSAHSVAGIAFNAVESGWTLEARRVRLAYRLAVNEYQGSRSPQLIVEHVIPLQARSLPTKAFPGDATLNQPHTRPCVRIIRPRGVWISQSIPRRKRGFLTELVTFRSVKSCGAIWMVATLTSGEVHATVGSPIGIVPTLVRTCTCVAGQFLSRLPHDFQNSVALKSRIIAP